MRAVVVVSLLALLSPVTALAQSAATGTAPKAAVSTGGDVTRDQYIENAKERAAKRFDRLDANRDGVLSPGERRAARAASAKRRASPTQ